MSPVGIALLITPFIPKLIDMFGKKNVFQFCGLFTIIGGIGLSFVPGNLLWLVLLALAIKGIGASLINTVMFGLEADTVEYGGWRTGRRSEGATYALFSFTRKVTQSIGGALGAWALAIGAYVAASDRYDAALILANVSDFAQQGALRITWSMPMAPEMPWYAAEVPTVFSRSTCPIT
jgi:Na+/melibiose symporter-like transporter